MGNFRMFIQFLRPLRGKLILCLLLTVMLTALSLTPPILLKFLADDVMTDGQWNMLLVVIAVMMAVPVGRGLVSAVTTWLVHLVGQKLIFDMRLHIYRHLQSLSMRFFNQMSTGAIMQRVMSDVNAVRSAVTTQTISLVTDAAACVFALSMCFWLNWRMALLVTLVLPLYVINYRYFVRRIRDANIAYRSKMDDICGTLQERLSAPAMVKSFSREHAETQQFIEDTRETYNIAKGAVTYRTSFTAASSLISGIGSTFVYFLGCYMIVRTGMGYGSVIAFMSYTAALFTPAIHFSEMFNMFEQVKVSLDRIAELLNVRAEITDVENPVHVKRFDGHVTFENVDFGYNPGELILHDVNLDIKPGMQVALVGHTGSGKTTVASLLFRFYDVTSGRITIDGTDIRNIRLADLRRNLGVVMQDTLLFNISVRDNIRYGRPGASDDEVVEVARLAEIHSHVESLPDGYDTLIGPGGVKLSAGQSQRLAIARAVLTDPAILVLDEATSALDTESERLIQTALKRVMAGRTSFVIAHRLSTIVSADLIVVVHKGRIIETGRHIDLLRKKGGHYRELCMEQFAALMPGAHKTQVTAGAHANTARANQPEAERARVRQTG